MEAIAADAAPPPTTTCRVAQALSSVRWHVRAGLVAGALASLGVSASGHLPAVVRFALAACGLLFVAAALVDVAERRLPNRLVGTATAIALASAVATGSEAAARSITGLVVAGAAMLSVRLVRGVGMGDVKMAGAVGASAATVELLAAPVAIAIAALVAASSGVVLRRQRLPLGPSLWGGWAAGTVAGAMGWLG